jgi:hypothetical protein
MIRKILPLFFSLLCISSGLNADWMSDVSSCLENEDYEAAVNYLRSHLKEIGETPAPVVSGLLAYSYHRLQDKKKEYKWLGEYFENYRGEEIIFDFLDDSTYRNITHYLMLWKAKYPYVSELALIKSEIYQGPNPPDRLIIGIDIESDAYYRLSDGKRIMAGGLLKKGFNSMHIKTADFFQKSGAHTYVLDLKMGDLVVSKELEFDVKLDSSVKARKEVKVTDMPIQNPEFKISMYVGDELILESKKLAYENLPLKFHLPPWPENRSPYGPIYEDEFALNSFSIPGAVAAIYQLFRELKNGKKEFKQPKPVQKQMQVRTTFLRPTTDGDAEEFRAVITLKTRHIRAGAF